MSLLLTVTLKQGLMSTLKTLRLNLPMESTPMLNCGNVSYRVVSARLRFAWNPVTIICLLATLRSCHVK